ncbi:hypothetical protein TNCV_3913251 [Trichonephila clavipes]|nr:hypothetical protein TNCV_3913251 [Trichonephila clavipes]
MKKLIYTPGGKYRQRIKEKKSLRNVFSQPIELAACAGSNVKLSTSEAFVKIGPAISEISRNKQTDRQDGGFFLWWTRVESVGPLMTSRVEALMHFKSEKFLLCLRYEMGISSSVGFDTSIGFRIMRSILNGHRMGSECDVNRNQTSEKNRI